MRTIIGAAVLVRLGSRMRAPEGTPVGAIRRLNISNIVCSETDSQACSLIVGVPGHAIEDIKLSHCMVLHPGGGTERDATLELPEKAQDYPEPTMFGKTPVHGFFIRHARGVEMNDIKIKVEKTDARPCFLLEDVHDATFVQMKVPRESAGPVFVLRDVTEISVFRCKPAPDVEIDQVARREL